MELIRLSLILDNLSSRKQRTKIGYSYSSWYDIIRGVPQDSICPLIKRLVRVFIISKHAGEPLKRSAELLKTQGRAFETLGRAFEGLREN